ncbi:MAG: hypothetical protein WAV25_02455, partial [Minisyncoccia bacterium]
MNKDYFAEEAKYISAKVASKKTGYAQDHIGALVRSGKVSGKKIGRAWFVDLESLENHKNYHSSRNDKKIPSVRKPLEKSFVSASFASTKVGYAQDHIGALIRTGKVRGRKIGRAWFVDLESLETHKTNIRLKNVLKPTIKIPPIEPRLSLPHPISEKVIKYEREVAPKFVELSKDKYKNKRQLFLREILGGALVTSMLIMVVTLASVSGLKQIAKTDTFNKLANGSISTELTQGLNNTSASILATISDSLYNFWNNLFGKKENAPALVVVPPDTTSKTIIVTNTLPASAPAQTIINEYHSINQVTPLDLTLDDVVKNGDTTTSDVRLLGNVQIGKNLNIKGSIVSNSSMIAKNGSFSSLSSSGDFSALGKITLGNPTETLVINSKNVSIDKDGNTTFLGNFFSASASTTNVYAVNSTSTNAYISLLNSDTATITDFNGTNATLSNINFINATGTNSTTTNIYASNVVATNLNTNNFSLGTTSTVANLNITQTANGSTTIQVNRFTDAAPAGDFIRYNNAANDTTLFRVDNSGNLYAGGIINSGSQTITSTSQPQFRVQYDASNENTNSVTAAGVTTFGFNGSTPRLVLTPQSNRTDTFTFTDSSSNPILNVDTTNQRVGIGTTAPTNKLSVSGSADISSNLTVSGNAAFGGVSVQSNFIIYAAKTTTSLSAQAGLGTVLTLNPTANTGANYFGG